VQRICVYIVTNGTARVVSQSSCEDYGFACQIIKKSETTRCKVGQHDQEKLNCHRYITSQFAYHNFSTAGGIIIIRLLRLLRLLIYKIAVGKREAVAFKYRLKSILSCWCQPAPLAIPLQLKLHIDIKYEYKYKYKYRYKYKHICRYICQYRNK
jgi:hypothetical protein